MGTQTTGPTTAAAAAAYPPWMLVAPYGKYPAEDYLYFTTDHRTTAAAHTYDGHRISVALRPAPPPEQSRVCVCNKFGIIYVISSDFDDHMTT